MEKGQDIRGEETMKEEEVKEKLAILFNDYWGVTMTAEQLADVFVSNGVTIATDTNVGDKWITDGTLPKELKQSPETGWTPEVRPSEDVLCLTEDGNIFRGWISLKTGTWSDFTENILYDPWQVVAWKPLPQLPKEAQK